jgi:dTDP-4-amino-4,6-dideoxygalactose transaminase
MRIGRTLPPAATPIGPAELWSGLLGMLAGERELERFRAELRAYFGVRHVFLVSSGKAALALILEALREIAPDRNEVLIPAFTCFSVPSSIVRTGLRPRLCDLQPDGFDFDFAELRAMLGTEGASRTLALVPTHLFGFAADMEKAMHMVRGTGVAVVEDAAQAMGEARAGRRLGSLADAGFFSLARGKALSTVEGGIILTNRDDLAAPLARLVRRVPRYGLLQQLGLLAKAAALMTLVHPWLFWLPRSLPFLRLGETLYEPRFPMRAMCALQAGLARNWRSRLEGLRAERKAKAQRWAGVLERLGVPVPRSHLGARPALLRFPLRVADAAARGRLLREAASRGLGVMPAYPASIDAIPELQAMLGPREYPVAGRCARELVTLPTHRLVAEGDFLALEALLAHELGAGVSQSPPTESKLAGQP